MRHTFLVFHIVTKVVVEKTYKFNKKRLNSSVLILKIKKKQFQSLAMVGHNTKTMNHAMT